MCCNKTYNLNNYYCDYILAHEMFSQPASHANIWPCFFFSSKINQNGQVVIILFSLRSQNIILYPFKLTKKDKKINDGMKRGQRPNSSEQTFTTARVVGEKMCCWHNVICLIVFAAVVNQYFSFDDAQFCYIIFRFPTKICFENEFDSAHSFHSHWMKMKIDPDILNCTCALALTNHRIVL